MPIVCPHCMGSFERAIGPRCPYCHRLLDEPARPAGRSRRQPESVPPPDPNASVWEAWITVARRPSRPMFAAWAERVTTWWVTLSVIAAVLIVLLGDAIVRIEIQSGILPRGTSSVHQAALAWDLLRSIVYTLLDLTAFVLVLAWVSRDPQETVARRASLALRPIALAQVALALLGLFLTVSLPLLEGIAGHTPILFKTLANLAQFLLLIAAVVYGLTVTIRSAQAGSRLSGWRVFGVYVLSIIGTSIIIGLALHALGTGGAGAIGTPFLGLFP